MQRLRPAVRGSVTLAALLAISGCAAIPPKPGAPSLRTSAR